MWPIIKAVGTLLGGGVQATDKESSGGTNLQGLMDAYKAMTKPTPSQKLPQMEGVEGFYKHPKVPGHKTDSFYKHVKGVTQTLF